MIGVLDGLAGYTSSERLGLLRERLHYERGKQLALGEAWNHRPRPVVHDRRRKRRVVWVGHLPAFPAARSAISVSRCVPRILMSPSSSTVVALTTFDRPSPLQARIRTKRQPSGSVASR